MVSELPKIPRSPGIYALIVELIDRFSSRVGSLGTVVLEPSNYVYVGSARGPGGLYARIKRHVSKEKRIRWHIDYVTTSPSSRVASVVYAVTNEDLERELFEALARLGLEVSVKGFGCSDKGSYTHLLRCRESVEGCERICATAFRSLGLEPRVAKLL